MSKSGRSIEQDRSSAIEHVDALVVGAGFAGMYMVHRLTQLGYSIRGYEAGTDVGGTWYWNRYPGARCDIPSFEYSYSFSEDLEREWHWTERYPTQPELLRYANHVADRFDLRKHFTFETRVESAYFDVVASRWDVTTDQGTALTTQFLILAVGCLSAPKIPDIPGLEAFDGESLYTAYWPHEDVDFTGKRVGVIGTGSSGVQSVPIIAEQAASLTVFQRTPSYCFPAKNAPLDPEVERAWRAGGFAEYREKIRDSEIGTVYEMPTESALEADPNERLARFNERWEDGSLAALSLSYNDFLTSEDANDTLAEFVRSKIREIVVDPEVAESLCPKNYPIATRRVCLESNYYTSFNRDNVALIDVNKSPIVEITSDGIRTVDACYELDAIVYATGFDAMTGSHLKIDIRGRSGVTLRDKWTAGPRTYLGLGSAGFPNLFIMTGPGSPSVKCNMIFCAEQHADWIAGCIQFLRGKNMLTIEPTIEAEDAWVDHVNEVANTTLYPYGNSWYLGANIPGKARVFMPYIGNKKRYKERCDDIASDNYAGFTIASSADNAVTKRAADDGVFALDGDLARDDVAGISGF
jgi:cation diffusion facilitator CzcD-associated flavoprotein CzcO